MVTSHASRTIVFALAGLVLLVGAGFGSYALLKQFDTSDDNAQPATTAQADPTSRAPKLTVTTVAENLDHPWEIAFTPANVMYVSERTGAISRVESGVKTVIVKPSDVAVRGEGGMMGIALHPQFNKTPYLYACFNSTRGSDVRVVRWKVSGNQATERTELVTRIPSSSSGRHSGCRLGIDSYTNLWIGTGDAADEDNPQNVNSLGGKILRVDPLTGKGVDGNITNGDARIFSYGHRNVQGLAFHERETGGSYGYSVEHGPDVDDEVNELRTGNFGWAPGRNYDESVPMTDTTKFPSAIKSVWSSGSPTIATSDADFLAGTQWGSWNGRLAIGALKGTQVRILAIENGTSGEEQTLFDGEYGRIRAVTMNESDGSLYISTDNGGTDKILKITPSMN